MTGTISVSALRFKKNGSTTSTICDDFERLKEDHPSAFAVQRRKIGPLGLEVVHYRFDRLCKRAIFERFVSLFDRQYELEHYAHSHLQ
jgi:hypothetical protein